MNETEDSFPGVHPLSGEIRRPIVLVGMMGCGKTSIGKRLARQLGLPFVDADDEIAAAADLTIPEIFARFGEAHFRDGERRVIARLMESGPMVIATGGGAFADPETRANALAKGVVIWLDAAIDILARRVAKRGGRPLLTGRDPQQALAELMAVRRPAYAQAHIHVHSGAGPHQQAVDAIIAALADFTGGKEPQDGQIK